MRCAFDASGKPTTAEITGLIRPAARSVSPARKVAFNEGTTDDDFKRLRGHGIDDVGICEIVSMAMLESGMARHAVGVAPFENGDQWPKDNLPSAFYGENVNR